MVQEAHQHQEDQILFFQQQLLLEEVEVSIVVLDQINPVDLVVE